MNYEVKDCVHVDLSLPNYVREIINTKEFQRLNKLKQLGVSSFVFEGASYCRAEHCIGTAYLCKVLLEILERNSNQEIDELDKKCVILAGLLHDIGHGPFSHLWEGVVHGGSDKTWTHEQQSLVMIMHMTKSNNILLHSDPEKHDYALRLITSLITGDSSTWKELLTPQQMFITEIVSNKFCNIDVDKCDYLQRDYHYVKDFVNVRPFVDFMQRARIVFDVNGISHVGYHADDFELIENLFYNRAYLHMNIYQCHKVAAVERMAKDICLKADAAGFEFDDGHRLTEVQKYSTTYLKLDDSVLDLIGNSDTDNNEWLREAKTIYNNLYQGRHYILVWESVDDVEKMYNTLVAKFGRIFCVVEKMIPSAEVPTNIPIYDDKGDLLQMKSKLKLAYKSSMIYCVDPDKLAIKNIQNFIDSFNNNI